MTQLKYRADIDALRAIAVLSVIFYHFFPSLLQGGFIGVDLFFVISGFLISSIILEGIKQGTFGFWGFYERRIRRILPALLFAVTLTLAVAYFAFTLDQWITLGKHSLFSMFFLSNEILYKEVGYFDIFSEYKIFLHFWSLAIEEQFYLIWPLFLYFSIKKLGKWGIYLCIVCSLFYHGYLLIYDESAAFYRAPSRFWELLIGALLGYSFVENKKMAFTNIHLQSIVGMILLVMSLVLVRFEYHFPGYCALIVVLSAFLLIGAGEKAVVNRWLAQQRWLVWIGLLSYPLYLWHWILLTMFKLILLEDLSWVLRLELIALSIFMAWVSNTWVEKKLRFRKGIGVSIFLIIWSLSLAMLGLGMWKMKIYPQRMEKEKALLEMIYHENDFKAKYALSSCDLLAVPASVKPYCKGFQLKDLSSFKSKGIVLWGDSHAGSWSTVFFEYAMAQKIPVIVISHGAFPPILGARRSDHHGKGENYDQIGWNEEIFKWIEELQPRNIVLLSRWNLFIKPWDIHGVSQEIPYLTSSNQDTANEQSSRLVFQHQLPQTLQRFTSSDALKQSQVMVFKTVPILKYFIALGVGKDLSFIPSREEHIADQSEVNQYIDLAVQSVNLQGQEQIKIFDPTDLFCPKSNALCLIQFSGDYLYTDNNHISARGALMFKSAIEGVLKKD